MRLLLLFLFLGLCAAKSIDSSPHLFPKGYNRIVGGSQAGVNEFPWQVSFRELQDIGLNHVCGGVVIDEWWVVTAAHCCNLVPIAYFIVAGGNNNFFNETTPDEVSIEQHVRVLHEYIHPQYNGGNFQNDICLLELKTPLTFNEWVQPATLPEPTLRLEENTTLTVTGFGYHSESSTIPSQWLMKVDVLVVEDNKCDEAYAAIGAPKVVESMLCAGDMADGGEDACGGDSGGPYVIKDTDILVGLVSWGSGCARPGFPGVNTEVAYFVEWINGVINGAATSTTTTTTVAP